VKTVDARGQSCPQPVILTRKALTAATELLVIVDNEAAQMNVRRVVEKNGHHVETEQKADGIYLHITAAPDSTRPKETTHNRNNVVLVASDTLGRGEAELGSVLMRGFLHTLNEVEPLPTTLVLINSGVKLVAEDSPVLDDLRALCDKGVEVLACGTCLDYHSLKNKVAVGQVSDMYTITEALLRADKVISL
jgi:selenium metabolism protein YedF